MTIGTIEGEEGENDTEQQKEKGVREKMEKNIRLQLRLQLLINLATLRRSNLLQNCKRFTQRPSPAVASGPNV